MGESTIYIFAGGGTGGHLMPSLAVYECLREDDPDADAIFLCSDKAIDAEILGKAGVEFVPLPARPAAIRPFPAAPLRFFRGFRRSVRDASALISQIRDEGRRVVVTAMGGYCAAPVARAANRCEAPLVMVNLDVTPGKANRWIGRRSNLVLTAVPCPSAPQYGRPVGMPLRRSAVASGDQTTCKRQLKLDPDLKTLLVTGASQGATSLNSFMPAFAKARRDALDGWQALHLAGPSQSESIEAAYRDAGFDRITVLDFLDEMGPAWGAADLALSRAGASSVAEALANRTPTIFAPYPYHRDEHQRRNAEAAVAAGQAWLVRDTITVERNLESIGATLDQLLRSDGDRHAARERLESAPPEDGAAIIADRLRKIAVRGPLSA